MTRDEYRQKLSHKLRALIAVLRVALQKLERSRTLPGANLERLDKISDNLASTLRICNNALDSLQKVDKARKPAPSGAREYVELSSIDEYRKFQSMSPISTDEVEETNIDELIHKLLP